MQPSNQDKFCEALSVSKTAKTNTEGLDFGKHGDDINNQLFLVLLVVTAMAGDGTYKITWETSDDNEFGAGNVASTTLADDLDAADITAGTFLIKNAPLPRGLKRYNRLAFTPTLAQGETMTTAPAFTAEIVTGRDEPLT